MPGLFDDKSIELITRVVKLVLAQNQNLLDGKNTHRNLTQTRWLVKADAAISKDATGTVTRYSGDTKGSETTTGIDYEVYNRYGDIEAGAWCFIEFIDGGWEIYQGECG